MPVIFVPTPEDGVPRAGVTRIGEVSNTNFPLPVAPVDVTPSKTMCPFRFVVPVPPGVRVMFGFVPVAAIVREPVEPTVKAL